MVAVSEDMPFLAILQVLRILQSVSIFCAVQ